MKRAVIINAAPRSGSSLLFALLRRMPQLYTLSGESVPFFRLNGLAPDDAVSDEIFPAPRARAKIFSGMSRDFLSDCSVENPAGENPGGGARLDRYLDDLALRFSMEWPEARFSYAEFRRLAERAAESYGNGHREFRAAEFYLELIRFLRQAYPCINPYYYDIPVSAVKAKFPALPVPSGPPAGCLIEEPPFILLSPRKKPGAADLSRKTLLLKSSVDSYRMPFIETLLPNARIRIIHLVRNPAASINGLYDGWLHRGFFSHNLAPFFRKHGARGLKRLAITGYSDRCAWGKWWWKYDLPPGWERYARGRLEEVCAFQWRAANSAILGYTGTAAKPCHVVRYEHIIANRESREREIGRILDFIGVPQKAIGLMGLENLPFVQATRAPAPRRWKERENIIVPLLRDPCTARMSAALGYDTGRMRDWL